VAKIFNKPMAEDANIETYRCPKTYGMFAVALALLFGFPSFTLGIAKRLC
jgi:hypothetical protein